MNALLRATAILLNPAAEWSWIERERDDLVFLLTRYVALLALIPAACGFIGACVIGVIAPGGGLVRGPPLNGLLSALFGYVASFGEVFFAALLINVLAPAFAGRRDFTAALSLAIYSFTPYWLTGFFRLLPGLRFLTLAAFYGVYLLAMGLPVMMKSPRPRSYLYAAFVVVGTAIVVLVVASMQRALFDLPAL